MIFEFKGVRGRARGTSIEKISIYMQYFEALSARFSRRQPKSGPEAARQKPSI
jgi:hypothetical protein